MHPLGETHTAPLFRPLLAELLALLRGLGPAEWSAPTRAGSWRVRDIAAHLLDGDLRKLAACRDGHLSRPAEPITSDAALARFVDALNAEGVAFGRRLSGPLIADLLAATGEWVAAWVEGLDPQAPAVFPVSWAGEAQSANWMDAGREYTERWHHQMQIREAVGQPLLLQGRWLEPVLDLAVRSVPRALAELPGPPGDALVFEVDGAVARQWTAQRAEHGWRVLRGADAGARTWVRMDADDAWRMFFNGLPGRAARDRMHVRGDVGVADALAVARSVIVPEFRAAARTAQTRTS